jgi:hypothetical protein
LAVTDLTSPTPSSAASLAKKRNFKKAIETDELETPRTKRKSVDVHVISARERQRMLKLEKAANDARQISNEDDKDVDKRTLAHEAERTFDYSLFKISKRESSSTKWFGWRKEYFKVIELTDYGKEYAKTRKYLYLDYTFCCISKLSLTILNLITNR